MSRIEELTGDFTSNRGYTKFVIALLAVDGGRAAVVRLVEDFETRRASDDARKRIQVPGAWMMGGLKSACVRLGINVPVRGRR